MQNITLKSGESLASVLANVKPNTKIILEPREYREKIIVRVPNVTICGTCGKSKIIFGDYAKEIHADGLEFNTFRTYTVQVLAENVTFCNFAIENDAYEPKIKGQAVALSVYADNFTAENMVFKSMQDTVFVGPLPDDLIFRYDGFLPYDERFFEGEAKSLFVNCKIFGSVDYVFGCGNAIFYHCELINVDDGRKTAYVSAPSHSLKQKHGFLFYECDFKLENIFDCEVFLARPWRDYGKSVFIRCKLGNHVSPLGFDRWNDSFRNTTARFSYYDCDIKNAVSWSTKLSDEQAKNEKSRAETAVKKYVSCDEI